MLLTKWIMKYIVNLPVNYILSPSRASRRPTWVVSSTSVMGGSLLICCKLRTSRHVWILGWLFQHTNLKRAHQDWHHHIGPPIIYGCSVVKFIQKVNGHTKIPHALRSGRETRRKLSIQTWLGSVQSAGLKIVERKYIKIQLTPMHMRVVSRVRILTAATFPHPSRRALPRLHMVKTQMSTCKDTVVTLCLLYQTLDLSTTNDLETHPK